MDRDLLIYRMHIRKVKFDSRKEAFTAVSRMKGSNGLTVYKCPVCKKWHIGHRILNKKEFKLGVEDVVSFLKG